MTDEALVSRARDGDELAFRRLLHRHNDLIEAKLRTYFPPRGMDESDLRQEAEWGLAKAVRDFRPDRGSKFRNFAEICIGRQVVTAIKKATRNKHLPLSDGRSINEEFVPSGYQGDPINLGEVLPDAKADILRSLEGAEALGELAAAVRLRLSLLEQAALRCCLDGVSYEEVAEEEGVSVKSIDNALRRCRRKLAPVLEAAA